MRGTPLTSLVDTIQRALRVSAEQPILWTDSTIVLHWLNTSPHILKTFVVNRVAEIQARTQITNWRHVRTSDNPADFISRGQSPEEFLRTIIWHHGPDWLRHKESHWPVWEMTPLNIPEQKGTICLTTTPVDITILENYSSWGKMQRIVARCFRWKCTNTAKGIITPSELKYAHDAIIKLIQRQYFPEELRFLTQGKTDRVKGKLQRLNPFIDENGLLRVGGRLKHSIMPFSQKHPIILPKTRVTSLIIENEHRIQLHTGTQATLYSMRRRYWPIDGRTQVWKTIRNCVRCCRARPPPINYIMGDLPEARIRESRLFTKVGVLVGPFFIKERRHRNLKRIKVYVAVFVCLVVKAVHLELVSDLTSEAFIAALRRFIARRGFCTNLYSDNGTNLSARTTNCANYANS